MEYAYHEVGSIMVGIKYCCVIRTDVVVEMVMVVQVFMLQKGYMRSMDTTKEAWDDRYDGSVYLV